MMRLPSGAGNGMFILGSLLSMLRKAMEMAIHSQTTPQLSSSEEFLLVSFPTIGKKTIIHTSFIQAIMLLLSFDLPPGADPSDYKYFLDQWFPVQEENRPEAHSVESKEKRTFPHPSILPYLLLSNNRRILAASIATASPSHLCSFVTQFGSPLLSVEKVLEALDGLCEDHDSSKELRKCVHDPLEMCQFVEVHILRGVSTGKTFHSFLQSLASVPPTQPLPSISSIFESEKPSPSLISFSSSGSSHLSSLSSSTAVPARSGSQSSYAKLMNSSQEDLERMLQQCFLPVLGKRSSSLGKSQQVASELVSALRHCTSAIIGGATVGGASAVGGASTVGGATVVSESFVSGLIISLDKLLSNGKTKKPFLDGMIPSRHAISLFRMLTKIVQYSLKNGSSQFSLFQNTLQVVVQSLESYTVSSASTKYTLFSTAIKSCVKQLGVDTKLPSSQASSSPAQKLELAVNKACKEVGESKDLFRNKSTLIRLCQGVVQAGLPAPFEQLISVVVKRAICLGKEQQCIQFLFAVKTSTADSTLPVVVKFYPGYFTVRDGEGGPSRSQSPEDEVMETSSFERPPSCPDGVSGVHIDICGLLVDWMELLDPEVLSLSTDHSMKMVFGCSNTEQMSAILSSIQSKEKSELLFSSPLRISPSLLLSGQGYLQDRLTNSSSWPTLTETMRSLLSSDCMNEW